VNNNIFNKSSGI